MNHINHHILSWSIRLGLIVFSLFLSIFCALYFFLLPHIDYYKPNIENWLSQTLTRHITIGTIKGGWENFQPTLSLEQVIIKNDHDQVLLTLPKLDITASWLSLLVADIRLRRLKIEAPHLTITRLANGKINLAGWMIDPNQKSDSKLFNWIFSQHLILIQKAEIDWHDQIKSQLLHLTNVNFILKNTWLRHQFSFTATPPTDLSAPIDVRGNFKHRPLRDNVADFLNWRGNLYVDLQHTNLATLNQWIDYPLLLDKGSGNVRAWMHIHDNQLVNLTADVALHNVDIQLNQHLPKLDLQYLKGRIGIQELAPHHEKGEWGTSLLKRLQENGHAITLSDFTLATHTGITLPFITLKEQFSPQKNNQPQQFTFSANHIDLDVASKLLAYFPIPNTKRSWLQHTPPTGQLSDLFIDITGDFNNPNNYRVQTQFTHLNLPSTLLQRVLEDTASKNSSSSFVWPNLTHLSGQITLGPKEGKVALSSKGVKIDWPNTERPSQEIDHVSFKTNWHILKDKVSLRVSDFYLSQAKNQATFQGSYTLPLLTSESLPKENMLSMEHLLSGTLNVSGHISDLNIEKIKPYLPNSMNKDVRFWLTEGIQSGNLENIRLHIKGRLLDFPFTDPLTSNKTTFYLSAKIMGGSIHYTPHTFLGNTPYPLWPILSDIEGNIIFDRDSMTIIANQAKTAGIRIEKTQARIDSFFDKNIVLHVEGQATGKAQTMLDYIRYSPVSEWINHATQSMQMSGDLALKLRLALPLTEPIHTTVSGSISFDNNHISLQKNMPTIYKVKGGLSFTEKGITLNGIKGLFLGNPLTLSGGTDNNRLLRIKAAGELSVEGLKNANTLPGLDKLLKRINGKTPFSFQLVTKEGNTSLFIDSTLKGMSIKLPPPFYKEASQTLPLHIELTPPSPLLQAEKKVRDMVSITIGSLLQAYYLREKTNETDWQVIKGGLGIHTPAPISESGITGRVELEKVNLDALTLFLPNEPNSHINKTAAGDWFTPYISLDNFSIRAKELIFLGKKIDNVVLGASFQSGLWQANLSAQQVSGHITWDKRSQQAGHLKARLDSFILSESSAQDVADILQNQDTYTTMPSIDLSAEHLELLGKPLGRLVLIAQNTPPQHNKGRHIWQIQTLSVSNSDAELNAQGKWINRPVKEGAPIAAHETTLTYQLTLNNAGGLLDRLGYVKLLSGGKGTLFGTLNWYGLPYALNLPTLSGEVHVDVRSGQFLKVEPGAAKLLGVLNLQALPRRLMLDFRDVFSGGFAFDSILGDASIKNGVLKSDNLKMHGITATTLLSGQANIINETQDLQAVVIPEVNAGAASVLYGLAINPVIGAGTFLAQLFLREPLMKAFTFSYHITGSWKEPNVEKIKEK